MLNGAVSARGGRGIAAETDQGPYPDIGQSWPAAQPSGAGPHGQRLSVGALSVGALSVGALSVGA